MCSWGWVGTCPTVPDSCPQEEEERKAREEQAQREHEEYLKLKEAFVVEEEGVGETMSEEQVGPRGPWDAPPCARQAPHPIPRAPLLLACRACRAVRSGWAAGPAGSSGQRPCPQERRCLLPLTMGSSAHTGSRLVGWQRALWPVQRGH